MRRLNIETDDMKNKFTVLVGITLEKLIGKGTAVKTLKATLKNLHGRNENKITEELEGITDINDAFMVFGDFWSFFQYDILSAIIESFCRDSISTLDEYTSSLKNYCERRVCEVPNGSGGKESGEEKNLYIQVDATFGVEITRIKLENLTKLASELGKLLGTGLLFIDMIDGSIIISFKCLHEFSVIFPLCAKQEEKLQEIGVTKIYSKEKEYFRYSTPSTRTGVQLSGIISIVVQWRPSITSTIGE